MNFLRTAGMMVANLRQTVHARYGGGVRAYVSFFYLSVLRVNTFIIFARDCTCDATCPPHADELRFVRNDSGRLERLRRSRDLPKEFHCDRSHDAHDFVLGLWREEVAYIHWIFHENAATRFLKLGRHCAEINYILTLPEFRGRKLCRPALEYTVRCLSADGVKRVFCVIHDDNIASIKSVQRAGFTEWGRTRTIGPLNRRRPVTA